MSRPLSIPPATSILYFFCVSIAVLMLILNCCWHYSRNRSLVRIGSCNQSGPNEWSKMIGKWRLRGSNKMVEFYNSQEGNMVSDCQGNSWCLSRVQPGHFVVTESLVISKAVMVSEIGNKNMGLILNHDHNSIYHFERVQ